MNNEKRNVINSIFLILAIIIGIGFIVFIYKDTKTLTNNTNTEVNNNNNNNNTNNNGNNNSNNNNNGNNNNGNNNNGNNNNNNNNNVNQKIIISLSLNGNEEINILVGSSFSDPGYSAIGSNGVDYSNKVTVNGSVDTNKVGKYVITYSIDYLDNKDTLTRIVNVYSNTIDVTGIKTDKDTYSIYVGNSATIIATVDPSNATNKSLTYTSKDTSIATVSNGTVKGVKAGTTTITITDSANKVSKTVTVKVTKKETKTAEKIHFIKQSVNSAGTAGDAILLESNGHYAMIDTGIGNDKDRKFVYDYLKSVGVKKLDFLLITHPHSDHIGNAPYLMDKLTISKVYIKTYDAKDGSKGKSSNKKTYDELISKAKKKNVPVVYIDKSFTDGKGFKFQDMDIYLYNTKKGSYDNENGNSVLEYIKVNGYKVLLMADFYSYKVNREYILSLSKKSEFKNLDLIKIPHHGYTSCAFKDNKKAASNLNPKYLVITGHSSVCDQVFNSKIPRYYVKKINKNALVVTFGKTIKITK